MTGPASFFALVALASVLPLAPGCQNVASSPLGPAGVPAGKARRTRFPERDLAIYEAVFRFQFYSNYSGAGSRARAFFLAIEGGDPPKGFLDRFAGSAPPVGPASAFRDGAGLIFRVDEIQEIDPETVEVTGGYYEASLSASGDTYRVELREGSWVVVKDTLNWIS